MKLIVEKLDGETHVYIQNENQFKNSRHLTPVLSNDLLKDECCIDSIENGRFVFDLPTKFQQEVAAELAQAREDHAPMNSAHEGWAVLLEEVEEVWEEVRKKRKKRSKKKLRAELIQVASTAQRMIEDLGL